MGRKKQSDNEKRKIVLMWLDAASSLAPNNSLLIPMRHAVERAQYLRLGREFIKDMESLFDKSIYSGLVIYSTSKRGKPYLAIEKPNIVKSVAFVHSKDRTLRLMVKSRHTRKAQIILLLSEGFSKEEIIKALGKSITPEEIKILAY